MRLLSNLHVKGKPAVLPDRSIRRQSHYFIYRPRKPKLLVWYNVSEEQSSNLGLVKGEHRDGTVKQATTTSV